MATTLIHVVAIFSLTYLAAYCSIVIPECGLGIKDRIGSDGADPLKAQGTPSDLEDVLTYTFTLSVG